uniref:Uncharacterized protein n=1 Tax=Rhizoctonia solani TaxID=456999 RepID=N0AC03_9AGAM|nr:hypothetical protein RSOL_m01570 [Rhizoctonia solani]AGK45466.1 hypothetical protein RSOL_m01570 [Rhizoctonia solani]
MSREAGAIAPNLGAAAPTPALLSWPAAASYSSQNSGFLKRIRNFETKNCRQDVVSLAWTFSSQKLVG